MDWTIVFHLSSWNTVSFFFKKLKLMILNKKISSSIGRRDWKRQFTSLSQRGEDWIIILKVFHGWDKRLYQISFERILRHRFLFKEHFKNLIIKVNNLAGFIKSICIKKLENLKSFRFIHIGIVSIYINFRNVVLELHNNLLREVEFRLVWSLVSDVEKLEES